jgi:HPt (histidine-containing phosphotransfer) domain-containing protein
MALERTIDDLVAGTAARSGEPWNPPAELLELGDGLILELVKIFKTDTARRLSRIGDLLSREDFDGVKAAAHTIKGGARQMGVNAVASICEEVEAAARQASCEEVEAAARQASAPNLEERVALLRAAFSNICVEMAAFSASVETSALQFAGTENGD